ncbi:hypothetical protein VK792_18720 [Mesobacterium sp. TK19101]|uniref:Uncharacterized protein n=1 Tax=Mesobacterium hydrothermale TaxID=3111907 RepID=A0ABU6HLI7_9RHOB|nr:hypothetical protein [Mesobacterium sp. TK19101]MEC3863327.1 hypothetical protein [Mesobacterium sp. TK19101]
MLGIFADMMMTASRQGPSRPNRKERPWMPPARFWTAGDRILFDRDRSDD